MPGIGLGGVLGEGGRSNRLIGFGYHNGSTGKGSNQSCTAIGTLKTRVFTQNQQVFRAAAHARRQGSASAQVKSRAFVGSFSALSPVASIHLGVGLVAVVARRFVRVETGLVAGAILPKDRFPLGGVGLAVVVVEEFSLARVRFRYPIDRIVLEHPQNRDRSGRHHPRHPAGGRACRLRLHRDVLQPEEAPQLSGANLPCGLRTETPKIKYQSRLIPCPLFRGKPIRARRGVSTPRRSACHCRNCRTARGTVFAARRSAHAKS